MFINDYLLMLLRAKEIVYFMIILMFMDIAAKDDFDDKINIKTVYLQRWQQVNKLYFMNDFVKINIYLNYR